MTKNFTISEFECKGGDCKISAEVKNNLIKLADQLQILRDKVKKPIKRKINKLIVHCTATPECREIDITDVRRWHVEERGWSDVGYHFLVLLDGTIQEGRPLERQGSHTRAHNHDSIGVAYVGGMSEDMSNPKDTRTQQQKDSLEYLLCYLKILFSQATIYGHRDFSSKSCPSFDAKTEYENISNRY